MLLEEERKKILAVANELYRFGHVQLSGGNISIRDPKSGLIAITPSSVPYPRMEIDEILVIDENGNVVEGDKKPSIETPMHTLFYRKRPEINAVVHCHSVYSVAVASKLGHIPASSIILYYNRYIVNMAPYATPGSAEIANSALDYMDNNFAVVLEGHGTVSVGPGIEFALATALSVEDAAKIAYLQATMPGDIIPREYDKELLEF